MPGTAERQRKGCLERFSAGECAYIPLSAVIVIDDIQIQSAVGAQAFCRFLPFQLVLSVRHDHETGVGTPQDAVKIRHLDIRFQHDLLFSGKGSVGRVRKISELCKSGCQFLILLVPEQKALHPFSAWLTQRERRTCRTMQS